MGAPMSDAAPLVEAGDVLLETQQVSKSYPSPRTLRSLLGRQPRRVLRAVDGVDITIRRGRTLGVVGETGSGKSTLGRLVLGLERPTSGSITFRGRDLQSGGRKAEAEFRRCVQVVLQDPYTSLNPYRTVEQTLGEVLLVHGHAAKQERSRRIDELMERVGLPLSWRDRKPGQLSGGGRQRVSIARALAVEPGVLVADEPVSALDVSVQAQVLNLFADLQRSLGLAYLFITHDLAVLSRLADDVAVMYLGRVVEQGTAEQVLSSPEHPYTQALLAAAPSLGSRRSAEPAAAGELPDPHSPPTGCSFHTRCAFRMDVCTQIDPAMSSARPGHTVACHLLDPQHTARATQ
jgi:oligopeptide/dipeptide ABC transporter ATP-binding protein